MKTAAPLPRLLKRSGFTLMEVLLTAAVVSSGALVVVGVLSSGLTSSRAGLQGAQAAIIARGVLQDLQTGQLYEATSSEDERMTTELRPNEGLEFARQVLLLDAAGLPLKVQPSLAQADDIFANGSLQEGAAWLVSIVGTVPANKLTTGGQGQVLAGVNLQPYSALTPSGNTSSSLLATVPSAPAPPLAPTLVTVLVETPAAGPSQARQRYRFVELWNR